MLAFILPVIILCLISLYFVIPALLKILIRKKFLTYIKNNNRCIYLTFDDGPNPESTPVILNLLKKANAHATFFVTGKNVEKYPHLVTEIIESGNVIGEHGYNHLHAWKNGPVSSLLDMYSSEKVLKIAVGIKIRVKLFRPPHGKLNIVTLLYSIIQRKKLIFWDIDPEDYKAESHEIVAENVIRSLKPGCVILLHDGRKSADLSDISITIEAVKMIIDYSKKNNLDICTINE